MRFLAMSYWESASTQPGPFGIMAIIAPKYGESLARPDVTTAAHIAPGGMCGVPFCKFSYAVVPTLGAIPPHVSGHGKPSGIYDFVVRGIVAGHPQHCPA